MKYLRPFALAAPWLLMIAALAGVGLTRGFVYPAGHGWPDDLLDGLGIAIAVLGVLITGALDDDNGRRVPPGVWALGSGGALVLGQVAAAAVLFAIWAVPVLGALRRPCKTGISLPVRCGAHAIAAGPALCGITALGLVLEIWEDSVAPGGVVSRAVESGLLATLLPLLGLAWAASADGYRGLGLPTADAAQEARSTRLSVVTGLACFAGFLLLAFAVHSSPVHAWDTSISEALYRCGGRGVTRVVRRVSSAGGRDLMIYWVPAVLLGLCLLRRARSVRFLAFTILGTLPLQAAFKELFQRARPEFVRGVHLDSYPSGHALAATVLAGALLIILLPAVRSRYQQTLLWSAALVWPLLISFARVYLGAHYATDVIGGILLGISWICLCRALLISLARLGFGRRPALTPAGLVPAPQAP